MSEFNQPISGNEMPRFAGNASMFRLPLQTDAAGLDVAIVGVPLDIGTSNRGRRQGRDDRVGTKAHRIGWIVFGMPRLPLGPVSGQARDRRIVLAEHILRRTSRKIGSGPRPEVSDLCLGRRVSPDHQADLDVVPFQPGNGSIQIINNACFLERAVQVVCRVEFGDDLALQSTPPTHATPVRVGSTSEASNSLAEM